jgi:hypothetical protein
MKKKSIDPPAGTGREREHETGEGGAAATPRTEERGRTDGFRDPPNGRTGRRDRNRDADSVKAAPPVSHDGGKPADPVAVAPLSGDAAGTEVPGDEVFRDIIRKAARGDIKYQELYLKYIDLISGRMIDEDEVVYEATFIDDQDKET